MRRIVSVACTAGWEVEMLEIFVTDDFQLRENSELYRLTSSGARPHLMHDFDIFHHIFHRIHLHQYKLDRYSPGLYR